MVSEIESTWFEWPVEGGAMGGYLSRPLGPGKHAAVIVCMELFGVTAHIREMTERAARLGYVAVAPDFYHRVARRTDLPHDPAGRERGFELLHTLEREQVVGDLRATVAHLQSRPDVGGRVGVLGFSIGGHIACLAAARCDVAATAAFYPGWLSSTEIGLGRPRPTIELFPQIGERGGRIVLFFGGQDHVISTEQLELVRGALARSGARQELVLYPHARHGFFCDQRDTFDAPSRDDAWRRVQALFDSELRGEPQPATAR